MIGAGRIGSGHGSQGYVPALLRRPPVSLPRPVRPASGPKHCGPRSVVTMPGERS
ncbi:hypothetical protein KCH_39420 [Kitasatospora cheerisanensis KCTC 2395]|uniref:Uncharacterized protein n=1 Tax=Kitasatospora cheerisanensis KCTC 2395 TaxID=1348663 RepID=A0A066Z1F3_9ACTN|nr:hypothetical protein KCH_39420 [Kitasatospora cheerisanensis KCTC 2395]